MELPGTKRQRSKQPGAVFKGGRTGVFSDGRVPRDTSRLFVFLGDEERIPDRRQSTRWLVLEGFSDCGADNGA